MRFVIVALCLLITAGAYAEVVQSTMQASRGVTADTVTLTSIAKHTLPSRAVYSVYLTPNLANNGRVYVGTPDMTGVSRGTKLVGGFELTVTGGTVNLAVGNLNWIVVSGNTIGDRIHFIAETRE